MPAQTRRTPETAAPAVEAVETQGPVALESNAENQQALAGPGTAAGLANYQSTLGTWLGGELYEAVAGELSLESLAGHAESGLNSAIASLVDAAGGAADQVDEEALDAFGKALANRYDEIAADWVQENPGLQRALAGWVDANPEMVAGVALLAAAGAVFADVGLPSLKRRFNLAEGLDASVAAKLGSIQNLALEKITARLEYKSGPLIAAMKLEEVKDTPLTGELSAAIGDSERELRGTVRASEDGVEAWGLSGFYQVTEDLRAQASARQPNAGDPTYRAELIHTDGSVTTSGDVTYDENGRLSIGAALRGSTELGEGSGIRGGVRGRVDGLGLQSAGADATYTSEDRTVSGAYDWDRDEGHSADLRWDERFGEQWTARLRQQVQVGGANDSYETTGLAAYEAQPGLHLFGGASWRQDQNGGRIIPEIGAQVDGVPIAVRYDQATDTISVGIQLRF